MNWLANALTSEGVEVVVYAAVLLALALMTFTPRPIRVRLRTAVILGGAFAFMHVTLAHVLKVSTASDDVNAAIAALGAIAVARVAFVVIVDLAVERAGRRPMNRLLRDVMQFGVYVLVAVITLHAANMRPGSILATGTVLSAVIGLSMQDTLGNLFAGIAIQMERPVELGDWIRLDRGDVLGRVVAMNWRALTVETDDRARFVIPNGVFSKTAFLNHSRPGGTTRRSLNIVMPFDVPPAQVEEALLAACADCADVLASPPPSVLVTGYGERGVGYWLRFWIADFARRDPAGSDVATRVWYQLHRRKLAHAIPPQTVYEHRVTERSLQRRETDVLLDRRAAVDAVDFLRPLSDEAKDNLARRGHRRLFARGERIVREGEHGRALYIVRRGGVTVSVRGHEVEQLAAGQFFGELALLTGEQRSATVAAREETEVFEIDEKMFREVIQHEPEVAAEVSRIVSERQADLEGVESMRASRHSRDPGTFAADILKKVKTMFALD